MRSGSVAIRWGMPSSRAIGAVTNELVAVTTAQSAPAARWPATSSRAAAPIIGRIFASMNAACHASSCARG